MSMDFFKQMQDHVITCKKCTDLCFCEEAEAILRGEFPNVQGEKGIEENA